MPDGDANHSENTEIALRRAEIGRDAEIGSVRQNGGERGLRGARISAQQSRTRGAARTDGSDCRDPFDTHMRKQRKRESCGVRNGLQAESTPFRFGFPSTRAAGLRAFSGSADGGFSGKERRANAGVNPIRNPHMEDNMKRHRQNECHNQRDSGKNYMQICRLR